MFFIFGWNKPEISPIGPVNAHTCHNCHNTEYWHLQKVSLYFTLFFIPIFPYSSKFWYYCPVCNKGVEIDGETANCYTAIAEINNAFLNNQITEEERVARIEAANPMLEQLDQKRNVKYLMESEDFRTIVNQKTDDELIAISNDPTVELNPAFMIALEHEMKQRNLSPKAENAV